MANKRTKTRKQNKAKKPIKIKRIKTLSPVDPYLHCIMGPVNDPAMSQGYPDGDAQPSVNLDYRRVYTIKPDANGDIVFMLAPSAQGCLNMNVGVVATASVVSNAATFSGFAVGTSTAGLGQIPDELLSGWNQSLNWPGSNNSTPAFRPLVCSADVHYTGSSMMDAGRVAVTRTRCSEEISGSTLIDASTDYQADVAGFLNLAPNSGLLPSSVILPARQSFNVRSIPVRPLYETTIESVSDAALIENRQYKLRNSATAGFQLTPSYHSQCPWYRVEYSGLDQSASITISLKYCIQYAIQPNSTVAPFAHPSPTSSPSILQRAAHYVSNLAVARPIANTILQMGYEALHEFTRQRRTPALMNH